MKKAACFVIFFLFTVIAACPVLAVDEGIEDIDFFQVFAGHGSIMLIIDSVSGDIVFANRAAVTFYGYSSEELMSMKITEINTLTAEETHAEMQKAAAEKRNYFLFRHRLADGSVSDVEVYSYPYSINGQELLFSIITDITGDLKLEKHNRLLRTIVISSLIVISFCLIFLVIIMLRHIRTVRKKEAAAVHFNLLRQTFVDADERLIYLKDDQLRYIFVNKAVEKFYDLPADAIIGRDDYALTEKEFADSRRRTDESVQQMKRRVVDEVRWQDRIFKTVKFPVALIDGGTGVGAYIEEITQEYRARRLQEKNMKRLSIMAAVYNNPEKNTPEHLDYVLNECLELTESKYGFIFVYDPEKREFIINSWSHEVMPDCAMAEDLNLYTLEAAPHWGDAVRQKRTVIFNQGAEKFNLPGGHVNIERFASIPIFNDASIVAVIGLANKAEPYDQDDINQVSALMHSVWNERMRHEHSLELEMANGKLAAEQEKLQLILDSTAEAIYGLDTEGICTFCNRSCLEILGYSDPSQLVGRKLHQIIHHSRRDGSPLPDSECMNLRTVKNGEKLHVDDEVFWRKDGSSFDVEYFSYPQYRNDRLIGAVVTFTDITESRKIEERIQYLSYHDELTGLYNRRFFEAELKRLDTERNLPLSVIIGDVNALKLANDIFGHEAGDQLLKAAAAALHTSCRQEDIVARWGGDEFAILLPATSAKQAQQICTRIRETYAQNEIESIEGSISLGTATKDSNVVTMKKIMEVAEEEMYTRKTLERSDMACRLLQKIVNKVHAESPGEKMHAQKVSALSHDFAAFIGLDPADIETLDRAGFLHDIGKVIIDPKTRDAAEEIIDDRHIDMRQHPLTGFRILGFCEKTASFAADILQHHEHWDGSGYPRKIKGEEISLNARILSLTEYFERLTSNFYGDGISSRQALEKINRLAGSRFDPQLTGRFTEFILRQENRAD